MCSGVDWKSLTIPACLPITTDYFPDKRSLNNDYVLSIYTLLPDDVNADFMRSRAVQRKPLTTEEVFKELVSQRLAQVNDSMIDQMKYFEIILYAGLSTHCAFRATTAATNARPVLWRIHSKQTINRRASNA